MQERQRAELDAEIEPLPQLVSPDFINLSGAASPPRSIRATVPGRPGISSTGDARKCRPGSTPGEGKHGSDRTIAPCSIPIIITRCHSKYENSSRWTFNITFAFLASTSDSSMPIDLFSPVSGAPRPVGAWMKHLYRASVEASRPRAWLRRGVKVPRKRTSIGRSRHSLTPWWDHLDGDAAWTSKPRTAREVARPLVGSCQPRRQETHREIAAPGPAEVAQEEC